jgi:transcription initiation factor TFIIIB Brf1 subunit/transcription initiation factor TFIIB
MATSYWKGEQRCKWSEDRYSHALTDRKTKNMGFENTRAYFWRQNFTKAFGQLERLKEKLGLSDTIVEKAAYIYRKVQERGL